MITRESRNMQPRGSNYIINCCVLTNILYLYILAASQWPRGLRRRSTAACLPILWVRIPPGAWMFVFCECCMLSGRGLCDELITRPGESYRLWSVVVCDQETSYARRLQPRQRAAKYKPTMGCSASRKIIYIYQQHVDCWRICPCRCNFQCWTTNKLLAFPVIPSFTFTPMKAALLVFILKHKLLMSGAM